MDNNNFDIKYTKIFINNEWRNSVNGKTFETINPFNEKKIADIEEGDEIDIDRAVNVAYDTFYDKNSEWKIMDASKRGLLLYRLADLIENNIDHIATLDCIDNGKPKLYALLEAKTAIDVYRYYAGFTDKIHGKTIPADGDGLAYTIIEPVGVCGLIIPWNFPFLLASWKLAPALCSGNTVVLKPAEQTPLSALYLGSLIKIAGFPPGVVNIVPGFGPIAGDALVNHPKVDKISFTGSTEVGKIIMKNGANTIKRITLELGGKSPLVVSETVENIEKAARIAQDCCFFNMGQCCCNGTRTFVHESIYDEFVNYSIEYCQTHVQGDPFDAETIFGPQIDEQQMNKILDLIKSGKHEGAKCVIGGHRANCDGYFVRPTIFIDVEDDMRIAREEIFGPVQLIFKYKNIDEVIERCNNTEYGLGSAILTNDLNEAMKFSKEIRAGYVWINKSIMLPTSQTPFGGFKQSGIGRDLGENGLCNFGEIKTIFIKNNNEKI